MKPFALYVHIPFCARKCAYCDFASYPNREDLWTAYFAALEAELDAWRAPMEGRMVGTLFLGGGTPSLPPAEHIARLLNHIRRRFPLAPDAEITLEANPGTLTPEKLDRWRAAGVNRLSLGVQAFDDGLLCALGRIHSAQDARQAVALARAAGYDNLNLDLMYALPGQTQTQWTDTLDQAVALGAEHVSAYSLIVEADTPMAARVASGEAVLPDDDAVLEMQRTAIDLLARAGLGRYEISNYARPGHECRHNLAYWLRDDYLGVGCAAHSMLDDVRFENPASLDEYLSGARMLNRRAIPPRERGEELLMLATRTVRGMSLEAYARQSGEDFLKARERALRPLLERGLVKLEDGFLRLTQAGLELHNAVVLALVE